MSSPADRQHPFESPENKDGAPLYHSTDSFLPLGFSTPQHRNSGAGSNSHTRNYYSAQPKYMLPRQRGYQNRGRNYHNQLSGGGGGGGGGGNSPAGIEDGPSSGPPERKNFNNRNWKGRNFNQHQNHHQGRNRFGFGHHQIKDNSKYNINDYFHPSMLEDPWAHLIQKYEQDKTEEGDSDAGAGGGSSGVDED